MKKYLMLAATLIVPTAFGESHGGVRIANAQYAAAVNNVLQEASDLNRVLKVEKVLDDGTCSLFQIVLGGQDSKTGKVTPSEFKFLKVTSPTDDDGTVVEAVDKQVVEASATLPKC